MSFDPTAYTSAMFTELDDVIAAKARDDWNILELPTTHQGEVDAEEDSVFAFEVGMFVADFTEFSTYCYDLYETNNANYRFLTCPYEALKYYDGGALGIYMVNAGGSPDDIWATNETLYGADWGISLCPGLGMSCAYVNIYEGYNDIYYYELAVFKQAQNSTNS